LFSSLAHDFLSHHHYHPFLGGAYHTQKKKNANFNPQHDRFISNTALSPNHHSLAVVYTPAKLEAASVAFDSSSESIGKATCCPRYKAIPNNNQRVDMNE
jgi:hypothetical protein